MWPVKILERSGLAAEAGNVYWPNKNTMQVYLVTIMTHVIALEDGQSSQAHISLLHRSSR